MRLLLLTVLLLGALAALPGTAQACSCVPPGDPADDVARADAAVWGKVVRIKRDDPSVTLRIRVLRDYKGNLPRRIRLRTNAQSAACGLSVRRGQRIGLLLDRIHGRWSAGLCSVRGKRFLARGAAGEGGAGASAAACA